MLTVPSAYLRARRRRRPPAALGQPPGRPRSAERRTDAVDSSVATEGMSIPRVAGLILFVEVVYLSALAFAIPRGTGAVELAFAASFLLATVIGRRVGRCQPTSSNLKSREPHRQASKVTRRRRLGDRSEGSDATGPQEA